MKTLRLTKKFDFVVPQNVIDALWKMYNKYESEHGSDYSIIKNANKDSIVISEMQLPKNKDLLKGDGMKQSKFIENFKLSTEWVFYDDNVKLVEYFVKQHFSSAFQFRMDKLLAGCSLGWHDKHPYPRVFIPMHDNNCQFMIKNKTESQNNIYRLGECWMWDVRELHSVDNTHSSTDRIMACFNIDPEFEKNTDIFV